MQNFSVHTAGFVALTITELLLQECVMKGILSAQDVKRLLRAAARRHETVAENDPENSALNTQAAHLIQALMQGLAPLLEKDQPPKKKKKKRGGTKKKAAQPEKPD